MNGKQAGSRVDFLLMTLEKLQYGAQPEKITQERYDCIWVALAPRKVPSPLESQALQWVDWKLQGQISRFLLSEKNALELTFVPTMKRLPSPYLALQGGSAVSWESVGSAARGLRLQRLLFFCEDPSSVPAVETLFRSHASEPILDSLILGSDG